MTLAKHGWRVAVHYRSSEQDAINTIADLAINTPATGEKEGENTSKTAIYAKFQCDLSDEAAVRALLPQVIAHFGRVDAVVNSAAIFEHDAAATFSYGAMQKHLATNTGAAILLSQALHEHVSDAQKAGESGTCKVRSSIY